MRKIAMWASTLVLVFLFVVIAGIGANASDIDQNFLTDIYDNEAPEPPTDLACTIDGYTVNLTWSFTNSEGDLDHYSVYRKVSGAANWGLLGTAAEPTYTDGTITENGVYLYSVTAVDNGDPQLESAYSDSVVAPVGNLAPENLTAISNLDGVVPLSWDSWNQAMVCTTLFCDDGICVEGVTNYRLAKQFSVIPPIEICTVFVHVVTEGDVIWPYPDDQHEPVDIAVLSSEGSPQSGVILAETTATCSPGQWITIAFPSPIICTTDYFCIVWHSSNSGEALGHDAEINCSGTDWWYHVNRHLWISGSRGNGDMMIRASIVKNGVAELLTENNPYSHETSLNRTVGSCPQISSAESALGFNIYRSTSPGVPVDEGYRINSSYLMDTHYDDEDVSNGTTYYYVTTMVYSNNGMLEESSASNEVLATPGQSGYAYLPGDANMINGQWPPTIIGGDVTYLVGYFRGINGPCLVGGFYNSADANADCRIIGSDVTRLVSYFRGISTIDYCADYPPMWLISEDCPTEAPAGWPNCED
jgi:fibronectin type 3 domain-containing protein